MPDEKFHYLREFLWIFQFSVQEEQVLLRSTTTIRSIHVVHDCNLLWESQDSSNYSDEKFAMDRQLTAVLQLGRADLQPRGITSTFNKSEQRGREKA